MKGFQYSVGFYILLNKTLVIKNSKPIANNVTHLAYNPEFIAIRGPINQLPNILFQDVTEQNPPF